MSEQFVPSKEQANPDNESARKEAWGFGDHDFATPQEFIAADKDALTSERYENVFGDLDRTIHSGNNTSYEEIQSILDDRGIDSETSVHVEEAATGRIYNGNSLRELASIAREANVNGDKSTSLEAQTAIQDRLADMVENRKMTDAGAMNLIEQLDRVISSGLPERSIPEEPAPADTHEREHAEAIEENGRRNDHGEAMQVQRDNDHGEAMQVQRDNDHEKALEENSRLDLAEQQRRQQAQAEKEATNDRQILADYDEAMRVEREKAHTEALKENKEREDSEAISKLLAESKERDRSTTTSLSTALKGLATYISNVRRKKRAGFGSKAESAAAPTSDEEPAVTGKKKSRIGKLLGGLKASPKETSAKASDEQENTTPIASPTIGSVEPQWNGSRQQSPRERQVTPHADFNGRRAGSPADNPTVVIPRSGASRDNQDYPGNEAPTGPIAQTTRY